jgi:hypothetical protein
MTNHPADLHTPAHILNLNPNHRKVRLYHLGFDLWGNLPLGTDLEGCVVGGQLV